MRRECRPASCAAAWERASHLDKKPSPSVWFTKASIGAELVDAADGDHEALNSKGASSPTRYAMSPNVPASFLASFSRKT